MTSNDIVIVAVFSFKNKQTNNFFLIFGEKQTALFNHLFFPEEHYLLALSLALFVLKTDNGL